jgi:hypothetical protein
MVFIVFVFMVFLPVGDGASVDRAWRRASGV